MSAEESPLKYLVSCYYHQDWMRESGSSEGVIALFLRNEPQPDIKKLIADIEIHIQKFPEKELAEILKSYKCDYSPQSDFGSHTAWLQHIKKLLQAHLEKKI